MRRVVAVPYVRGVVRTLRFSSSPRLRSIPPSTATPTASKLVTMTTIHASLSLPLVILVTSFVSQCWAFGTFCPCQLTLHLRSVAGDDTLRMAASTREGSDGADGPAESTSPPIALTSIFIDVTIPNRDEADPLRLTFHIPIPNLLPQHAENIIALAAQSRRSIDSRCHYVGCTFRHSPQFVEGFPQYRWAHVLDGRGINAIGRGQERIEEKGMTSCRVTVQGSGDYYGTPYDPKHPVVLTVPLVGPGRGSTSFSIVRVGDSPQEWGERLLINSAVVGWLDDASKEALTQLASQTDGPPTVVDSGILE